jgi:syntaxin 8
MQSLPSFTSGSSSNLHLPQITRNMNQLHSGILALEAEGTNSEAVSLLKNQYGRMRGMLGSDMEGVPRLVAKCILWLSA